MPHELDLKSKNGEAAGAFTKHARQTKEDEQRYEGRNPFKKKGGDGRGASPYHECYNRRTLVVDKFNKCMAIYSANRVVQS